MEIANKLEFATAMDRWVRCELSNVYIPWVFNCEEKTRQKKNLCGIYANGALHGKGEDLPV